MNCSLSSTFAWANPMNSSSAPPRSMRPEPAEARRARPFQSRACYDSRSKAVQPLTMLRRVTPRGNGSAELPVGVSCCRRASIARDFVRATRSPDLLAECGPFLLAQRRAIACHQCAVKLPRPNRARSRATRGQEQPAVQRLAHSSQCSGSMYCNPPGVSRKGSAGQTCDRTGGCSIRMRPAISKPQHQAKVHLYSALQHKDATWPRSGSSKRGFQGRDIVYGVQQQRGGFRDRPQRDP